MGGCPQSSGGGGPQPSPLRRRASRSTGIQLTVGAELPPCSRLRATGIHYREFSGAPGGRAKAQRRKHSPVYTVHRVCTGVCAKQLAAQAADPAGEPKVTLKKHSIGSEWGLLAG